MSVFQLHDGRARVGDLFMREDELYAIRPDAPRKPEAYRSIRYDGDSMTLFASNGWNQSPAPWPIPWAEAEALLNDENLATDLATYRAEQVNGQ